MESKDAALIEAWMPRFLGPTLPRERLETGGCLRTRLVIPCQYGLCLGDAEAPGLKGAFNRQCGELSGLLGASFSTDGGDKSVLFPRGSPPSSGTAEGFASSCP
jgi:hypothetical protein